MKVTKGKIIAINRLGLEGKVYWLETEVYNTALALGHKGVDLSNAPIVSGWRYGRAPDGYISYNYRDGHAEYGLSLAALDGEEPVASAIWFSEDKKYHYRGIYSGRGSDNEPLILCLDADDWDS